MDMRRDDRTAYGVACADPFSTQPHCFWLLLLLFGLSVLKYVAGLAFEVLAYGVQG